MPEEDAKGGSSKAKLEEKLNSLLSSIHAFDCTFHVDTNEVVHETHVVVVHTGKDISEI